MAPKKQKFDPEVSKLMRSTGVRPELIYAYEVTGFLLTEEGYRSLSKKDRAEYDAAIDAYLFVSKMRI